MPGILDLRVTLLDTWEEAILQLPSTALVSDLKGAVLAGSKLRRAAADYLVKYRGAELDEAGRTLADAGIPQNAALIVMRRRRVPVR